MELYTDSMVEKGEVTQRWKEWSCTTTAWLRKGRSRRGGRNGAVQQRNQRGKTAWLRKGR